MKRVTKSFINVRLVGMAIVFFLSAVCIFAEDGLDEKVGKKVREFDDKSKTVSDFSILIELYMNNEVQADVFFKNKFWRGKGTVVRVGKDMDGSIYALVVSSIASNDMFSRLDFCNAAKCYFPKSETESVSTLCRHDRIIVRGICSGMVGLCPVLMGCHVESKLTSVVTEDPKEFQSGPATNSLPVIIRPTKPPDSLTPTSQFKFAESLFGLRPTSNSNDMSQTQRKIPTMASKTDAGVARRGPTALNVVGMPQGAYSKKMFAEIGRYWTHLLELFYADGQPGRLKLSFTLYPDGHVDNMKVAQNTASPILGKYCQKAVTDCAPFDPWPQELKLLGGDHLDMTIDFNVYQYER